VILLLLSTLFTVLDAYKLHMLFYRGDDDQSYDSNDYRSECTSAPFLAIRKPRGQTVHLVRKCVPRFVVVTCRRYTACTDSAKMMMSKARVVLWSLRMLFRGSRQCPNNATNHAFLIGVH